MCLFQIPSMPYEINFQIESTITDRSESDFVVFAISTWRVIRAKMALFRIADRSNTYMPGEFRRPATNTKS